MTNTGPTTKRSKELILAEFDRLAAQLKPDTISSGIFGEYGLGLMLLEWPCPQEFLTRYACAHAVDRMVIEAGVPKGVRSNWLKSSALRNIPEAEALTQARNLIACHGRPEPLVPAL